MNDNEVVTVKFLRNALAWLMMLDDDSSPSRLHGLELQQEMDEKYPATWMAILYKIGRFEGEQTPPYWQGHRDYQDGVSRLDNLYDPGTTAWDLWFEGWEAASEEA